MDNIINLDEWMTIREAAEYLGVSEQAVHDYKRYHGWPAHSIKGIQVISRKLVEEWKAARDTSLKG